MDSFQLGGGVFRLLLLLVVVVVVVVVVVFVVGRACRHGYENVIKYCILNLYFQVVNLARSRVASATFSSLLV